MLNDLRSLPLYWQPYDWRGGGQKNWNPVLGAPKYFQLFDKKHFTTLALISNYAKTHR